MATMTQPSPEQYADAQDTILALQQEHSEQVQALLSRAVTLNLAIRERDKIIATLQAQLNAAQTEGVDPSGDELREQG